MKYYHFISFLDNIQEQILQEADSNSLLIFPTNTNRNQALAKFRKHYPLAKTDFITWEDLMNSCFTSTFPILTGDLRYLAFYASLSKDVKEKYKITDYFSSIDFANNFFQLWDDFAQEQVKEDSVQKAFVEGYFEFYEWQMDYYEELLKIKQNYLSFLQGKSFQDKIFLLHPDNMNIDTVRKYQKIILVNQTYFSGLEKQLIQTISEELPVHLYFQLPEKLLNKDDLSLTNLKFSDLWQTNRQCYRNESIKIIAANSEYNQIALLNEYIQTQTPAYSCYLDFNSERRVLEDSFAPSVFRCEGKFKMLESKIYQFLFTVSLLSEQTARKKELYLFPLKLILDTVQDSVCFSYFAGFSGETITQEDVKKDIYKFLNEEYKFLDTTQTTYLKAWALEKYISGISAFLDQFNGISSFSAFKDFLSGSSFFKYQVFFQAEIAELIIPTENKYQEVIFTFSLYENFAVTENWQKFLNPSQPLSHSLLRLFRELLKGQTVAYSYQDSEKAWINMAKLIDTRNNSYEFVYLNNVNEGQIPATAKPQFLFNEAQRKVLGLKTFADIHNRELYYFYRLILNSRNVIILYCRDLENNIERSSIVEQILLSQIPTLTFENRVDANFNLSGHKTKGSDLDNTAVLPGKDRLFKYIPSVITQDFPEGKIILTPYVLKLLLKNPFAYFLKNIAGIEKVPFDISRTIPAKKLGILVHNIMEFLWKGLKQKTLVYSDIDEVLVNKIIKTEFQQSNLEYFVPEKYGLIYLEYFLLPQLAAEIVQSFPDLNRKIPPDVKWSIEIEKKISEPQRLFHTDLLEIFIKGVADVLLVSAGLEKAVILDFKTGESDFDQLVLYELFYFILEEEQLTNYDVNSYFLRFFNKYGEIVTSYKTKDKDKLYSDFITKIQFRIKQIEESGYYIPDKAYQAYEYKDLLRMDL